MHRVSKDLRREYPMPAAKLIFPNAGWYYTGFSEELMQSPAPRSLPD